MSEKKYIKITSTDGSQIYGYYCPDNDTFWCIHGGWEDTIKLIDESTCDILDSVFYYEFLDSIPDEYNM